MIKFISFAGLCTLLLLIFMACHPAVLEKPTLSEEKMVQIMADLATAEAAVMNLTGTTKDSMNKVYFNQVLEMHHLSLEEYEKNLRAYTSDIPTLERITKAAETSFDMDKKASPTATEEGK